MRKDMNKYDVEYNFISPTKGNTIRHHEVYADSFGEAEENFDDLFFFVNEIADDVYGDDVLYEIISITKTSEESEVK